MLQRKVLYLISLPSEGDLLSVLHALVDLNLQNFPLAIHLASVALFAPQLRVDPLALALALAAHGLDLLHHTGSQLLDANLHTGAAAGGAALYGAGLSTDTYK